MCTIRTDGHAHAAAHAGESIQGILLLAAAFAGDVADNLIGRIAHAFDISRVGCSAETLISLVMVRVVAVSLDRSQHAARRRRDDHLRSDGKKSGDGSYF